MHKKTAEHRLYIRKIRSELMQQLVEMFPGRVSVFSWEWRRRNCLRLKNGLRVPVCEELKIPKIRWHSLRHANATLLDAVGTPLGTVQSLLGHASPEITRGIYLHSLPAGAKEAVQKVEDLLTGPKRTQIEEIRNLGSSLIQ
jgi:integrase